MAGYENLSRSDPAQPLSLRPAPDPTLDRTIGNYDPPEYIERHKPEKITPFLVNYIYN